MKFSKKTLCAMMGALLAALLAGGCGGGAKVAYIDGQRIIEEAPQIKAIIAEGNEKIMAAQEEAENDLAQKEATMTPEELQKAQRDAQQKLMSLNQQYSMQMKEKLDTALAAVSEEKKLDVVFDNEAEQKTVIHGGEDVTDAVIAKLQ